MSRSKSRQKLQLVVDILLESPKLGWFTAVLIDYLVNRCLVNRATIGGEPVYHFPNDSSSSGRRLSRLKIQT
jgi:hypothetical protein